MHYQHVSSPQRLYHPTPISPAHRFEQILPSEENDEYTIEQEEENYSTSGSELSGMTLAAVAAAAAKAGTIFNQTMPQEGAADEVMRAPTQTKTCHALPGKRRLFIHPYSHGQIPAPPSTAPLSSCDMSAAPSATSSISSSSTGTFSTHDPPTPGFAPLAMLYFAAASKTTAGATGAGAYAHANYIPQHAPKPINIPTPHQQQLYQNPPQTAPLPARNSIYEEAPPPPPSAHTILHYAQYQTSELLSAAARHHSKYPGTPLFCLPKAKSMAYFQLRSNTTFPPCYFCVGPGGIGNVAQLQPQLPPPETYNIPSGFPNSPFHATRTFPPVQDPEHSGYPTVLPPLRGFSSHRMLCLSILR